MQRSRLTLFPLLFALAATAGSAAADVRLVTAAGDLAFAELQPAVDAAIDGDVLLVAAGDYAGFTIDGKTLSVFAVPEAGVLVARIIVKNLLGDQAVVLSGLAVHGLQSSPQPDVCLHLLDNQGYVRVQDCVLGFPGSFDPVGCPSGFGNPDGHPAVHAESSSAVALLGCAVVGGYGMDDPALDYGGDDLCSPGVGGAGVRAEGSSVALYDCAVIGGAGGHNTGFYGGARGGPGVHAAASEVFSSGCAIEGGATYPNYFSGPGAAGVWLAADGVLRYLDSDIRAGFAGAPGALPIDGAGTAHAMEGSAKTVVAPTVIAAGRPLDVTFVGEAGDVVWFPRSVDLGHVFVPGANGVWLTPFPPPTLGASSGAIAPNRDRAHVSLDTATPTAGAAQVTAAVQGFVLGELRERAAFGSGPFSSSHRALTGARHVLVLDPHVGPDCNGNGVSDYLDVTQGTSADANGDVVPDECGP